MKQLNQIIVNTAFFLCIMETGIHAQTGTQSTAASELTPVRQLSGNIINLSFELYSGIGKASGNCFFSPYSISMGLSMLWYGARGTTKDEIAGVMHSTFTGDELRTAYMSTAKVFDDNRNALLQRQDDSPKFLRLLVANGYWVQNAYPLRKEYTDIMRNTFGAESKNLDFITAPEESRRTINTWISDRTERMIENILPPGVITSATRLVLANTVYFEAKWDLPFVSRVTVDGYFHLLDGSTVTVPMMHQRSLDFHRYTDTSDWQAAELPYCDKSMVMLIILPRPGRFEVVERSLSAEMLSSLDDSLRGANLDITFPKFKFTSPSLSLRRILSDLGMKTAFAGKADFSGITSNRELVLDDVFHKASVTVDEEGTIAAAATVGTMLGGTPMSGPIAFTVDRPFIFIIRDHNTRMVLFIGRMVDPSK
jgi:serpin B